MTSIRLALLATAVLGCSTGDTKYGKDAKEVRLLNVS